MPVRDRRTLVGAFVTVAAVAFVLLAWQRPNPFATHETVHALFADAGGLAAIGADVRMAGTTVGKVTGRRRVGDHAELTLELHPGTATIHRDARAEIRPRLMFEGTAYVDLSPGSASAPRLGAAVLPLARTRVYVPIMDALEVLRPRSQANLRQLSRSLSELTGGPVAAQMQSALRAAPALMRSAAPVAAAARGSHSRELREAITGLAATTRAVAAQAGALPEVEDSSAQTAQALTGTALDSSLAKLPAVTARVRDTAGALHGAIAELTPLAADLRPAAAQLAPTIARVKPLLSAAKPALAGAGPLIRNLRAGLDPAPAYAPAVSAAMAATAPTLSTANDSLLPALAKPTSLGTPAYLAFLGLFAGGGGASRPFGVDGQGHFMRFGLRFLTGAGQPLPPCSLLAKVNQQLADQLSNAGGCTP